MKAIKPYRRPMRAWWRRDPFFGRYMWREATAVAVAVYALLLLAGLVCLSQGEPAWLAWLALLRTPAALLLHAVLLLALLFHAQTWFEVMPKTMPMLFLRGRRVPAATITRVGWAATGLASALLLGLVLWSAP